MGIVANTERQAKQVARKNPTRTGVTTTTQSTENFLAKFPIELRLKVLTKAVRAGGGVVRDAARKKVERSSQTGSREHWSKKTAAKREGNKDLRQSIAVKVVNYETSGNVVAHVGGRWPDGAHAHLVEFGYEHHQWGRDPVSTQAPEPFMRPAAKETEQQQTRAVVEKIDKEWTKI